MKPEIPDKKKTNINRTEDLKNKALARMKKSTEVFINSADTLPEVPAPVVPEVEPEKVENEK